MASGTAKHVILSRLQDTAVLDFVPHDAYLIYALISKDWLRQYRRFGAVSAASHFTESATLMSMAVELGGPPQALANSAVRSGNVELTRLVHINHPQLFAAHSCTIAAREGHLKMLEWLISIGCIANNAAPEYAAMMGRLDILMWLHTNHRTICDSERGPITAGMGYMPVGWYCRDTDLWSRWLPAGAARGGHLDVLKWMRDQGISFDDRVAAFAALGGHWHIMSWLRGAGVPCTALVVEYAARGGHLSLVQQLIHDGYPVNSSVSAAAAEGGHIQVLEWLHATNPPNNTIICSSAALGGQLQALQWLRSRGCPWDWITCYEAASRNHVDVLRWARENGCDWNEDVVEVATRRGHIEALQYLLSNGCPVYPPLTPSDADGSLDLIVI